MEYTTIKIQNKGNYDICQLSNGKGNAINKQLISELAHYFANFPSEGSKGCILTGTGNIFSVGLDIKELISLNDKEVEDFFASFFNLVLEMVKFPYPLVAAINGHSPAGGCVFALTADYRVMPDDERFKIGLNELPVGVMATPAIFHLYSFWIGVKNAYQNLLTGALLSPTKAKSIQLVDELVLQEGVLEAAERKMKQYLSFDQPTWSGMKQNFRLNLIQQMEADQHNDHNGTYVHFIKNDGRGKLQRVLEALAKRQ